MLFEDTERCARYSVRLANVSSRFGMQADELLLDAHPRLENRVGLCPRDHAIEHVVGLREPACVEERLAELRLKLRRLVVREQRARPLKEGDRCRQVGSAERLPPGRAEKASRPGAELGVGAAELLPESVCLLEVVADERVESVASLLEPVGVALVQPRACGFRDCVVGRVTQQQVAEAESVLAFERGTVRSHELVADKRGQLRRQRLV